MRLQDIDITTLLPQRRPFVFVDTLEVFDERRTACSYTVPEDGLMTEEGRLSVAGMTENIAQTCAARIGYYNKYILKKGISIGYIGGIKDLRIYRRPAVGERIWTEITVKEDVFGITLADAVIRIDGEVLAETEIKIAMTETPSDENA